MSPINTNPNIELTLVGLLVVFPDPTNKKCSAGILRDAPEEHTLNISVLKADDAGVFQPFAEIEEAGAKDKLEITVSNTSTTGISRRKMDAAIDRLTGPKGGNNDSFRWVVDFESEIYQKPIGAKKAGFVSMLRVNNGELLARKLSENELIIKQGMNDPGTLFGKVATQTGIDIKLDQPNSKAVFKNGDKVVFEADSKSRFRIIVSRGCSNHAGNDADAYYSAVGDKVPDPEKIFFASTPLPPQLLSGLSAPNDPDAKCLITRMSRSRPS